LPARRAAGYIPRVSTLAEQILVEPTRERVVAECVPLIDSEVKSKGGMGGIAVRTAYATIKTIKKGFIRDVVDALLDDWVGKMEPYYETWNGAGRTTSFTDYLVARSDDVADALLEVTDERAASTRHKTAGKAYKKIRGGAKDHVATAVPGLAALVERHLKPAA